MRYVTIGKARVSGLVIGGNPFSGFSHQSPERDREMLDWYTPERIMATLRAAEAAGINTFFGRTDEHIHGILRDYWASGGKIQWFAQVSANPATDWRKWLAAAAELKPAGMYIHGGIVDHWHATGQTANFTEALRLIRAAGAAAGFAGHQPAAHAWIRDHLEPDFQMCCYYNPSDRSRHPAHIGEGEVWDDEARTAMLEVIADIPKPVVHYKVLAGGHRPAEEVFQLMARTVRASDVVCLGMFLKDDPDLITKNVALCARYLERRA